MRPDDTRRRADHNHSEAHGSLLPGWYAHTPPLPTSATKAASSRAKQMKEEEEIIPKIRDIHNQPRTRQPSVPKPQQLRSRNKRNMESKRETRRTMPAAPGKKPIADPSPSRPTGAVIFYGVNSLATALANSQSHLPIPPRNPFFLRPLCLLIEPYLHEQQKLTFPLHPQPTSTGTTPATPSRPPPRPTKLLCFSDLIPPFPLNHHTPQEWEGNAVARYGMA